MSSFSDPSVREDKVKWLDETIVELEQKFQHTIGRPVRKEFNVVKETLLELKRVLIIEEMAKIASCVQNGDLSLAKITTGHCFTELPIGKVEELITLAYTGNRDNLKNVIDFTELVCPRDLKFKAFTFIYNEMDFKKHLNCKEILLLGKFIRDLNVQGGDFAQLESTLAQHETKFTSHLAQEINSDGFSDQCLGIENALGVPILDATLHAVFGKITGITVTNVLTLINLASVLSALSSKCIISNHIFKKLEADSQLETSKALHLWAFVFYSLLQGKTTDVLAADMAKFCGEARTRAVDFKQRLVNLFDRKNDYFQLYVQLLDSANDEILGLWHDGNPWLDRALPEIMEYYCDSNRDVTNLLRALKKLGSAESAVHGLKALHGVLEAHNLKKSFSYFELFYEVKSRMDDVGLESKEREILKELKKSVPICIKSMLWYRAPSEIRLANKFFVQSLSFEPGCRRLTTSDLSRSSDDQIWTMEFHTESHLASLRCHTYDYGSGLYLHQPAGVPNAGLLSNVPDNFVWRIHPRSDEFFKISSKDGKNTFRHLTEDISKRIFSLAMKPILFI